MGLWVKGANWKTFGPEASSKKNKHYPVVHICYFDALAYAKWWQRLHEANGEWAARGNLKSIYPWGNEPVDIGSPKCNYWSGTFQRIIQKRWICWNCSCKSTPPNETECTRCGWKCLEIVHGLVSVKIIVVLLIYLKLPTIQKDLKLGIIPVEPLDPKRALLEGGHFFATTAIVQATEFLQECLTQETGMSHTGFRCVKDL